MGAPGAQTVHFVVKVVPATVWVNVLYPALPHGGSAPLHGAAPAASASAAPAGGCA